MRRFSRLPDSSVTRRSSIPALLLASLLFCGSTRTIYAQPIGARLCELGEGSSIELATALGPIVLDMAGKGSLQLACGEIRERSRCPGDCDGDNEVQVEEIVFGVRAGLRQADIAECPLLDRDGSNAAEIDEIVAAVASAVRGCPATIRAAECTCDIATFEPIPVPGIGFLCASPAPGCPPGAVFCSGGQPRSLDLYSERVIGECEGNEECERQCRDLCASRGTSPTVGGFGCEGYCEGGERDGERCDCDTPNPSTCRPVPVIGDCPGGHCHGRNGAAGGLCQCQCLDSEVGPATAPGGLQCNLGIRLVVEGSEGDPCDGENVLLDDLTVCVPMTTETVTAILHDGDDPRPCAMAGNACETDDDCPEGDACTPPSLGPVEASGHSLTCDELRESVDGLRLEGVMGLFGSQIGDVLARVSSVCGGGPCALQAGSYTLRLTDGAMLRVATFSPFPLPSGGTIVADVSHAEPPTCVHDVVVPAPGGFDVPASCIPATGFTFRVEQTGCGIGRIDSNGGSDFTIQEIGDTSAPTSCDMPASTCPSPPGDGNARVDVTVGDGSSDSCGSGNTNMLLSIPVMTRVWESASFECPDPDGVFDPGTDSLILEFAHILDLTTDTSATDWADLEPDGCCISGIGPASATCDPFRRGGQSRSGACLDVVARTVTLAASGAAGATQPLYDLTFTAQLPGEIEGPDAPLGSTCNSPPLIDFAGTAMRCIR